MVGQIHRACLLIFVFCFFPPKRLRCLSHQRAGRRSFPLLATTPSLMSCWSASPQPSAAGAQPDALHITDTAGLRLFKTHWYLLECSFVQVWLKQPFCCLFVCQMSIQELGIRRPDAVWHHPIRRKKYQFFLESPTAANGAGRWESLMWPVLCPSWYHHQGFSFFSIPSHCFAEIFHFYVTQQLHRKRQHSCRRWLMRVVSKSSRWAVCSDGSTSLSALLEEIHSCITLNKISFYSYDDLILWCQVMTGGKELQTLWKFTHVAL